MNASTPSIAAQSMSKLLGHQNGSPSSRSVWRAPACRRFRGDGARLTKKRQQAPAIQTLSESRTQTDAAAWRTVNPFIPPLTKTSIAGCQFSFVSVFRHHKLIQMLMARCSFMWCGNAKEIGFGPVFGLNSGFLYEIRD
jgi:hypothetical protein